MNRWPVTTFEQLFDVADRFWEANPDLLADAQACERIDSEMQGSAGWRDMESCDQGDTSTLTALDPDRDSRPSGPW